MLSNLREDWRHVALLLLTSPIWLAAGAVCLACAGLLYASSILPELIRGMLLVPILFVMAPFGEIVAAASHTAAYLGRERVSWSDNGIYIRYKRRTSMLPWDQVERFIEIRKAPICFWQVVLKAGAPLPFSPYVDMEALLAEALRRSLVVEYLSRPRRK